MAEIDRDRPVELGRRDRGEFIALVVGGVVDEDSGRAERGADFVERGAQRVDIGQIAAHDERLVGTLREAVGEGDAGVFLQVEKPDARLVLGKRADERSADAAGAAGDDDRAAVERIVAGEGHRGARSIAEAALILRHRAGFRHAQEGGDFRGCRRTAPCQISIDSAPPFSSKSSFARASAANRGSRPRYFRRCGCAPPCRGSSSDSVPSPRPPAGD